MLDLRRRGKGTLLVAFVVAVLLAGAVAGAIVYLTGSSGRELVSREAKTLQGEVLRVRRLHFHPTHQFPPVRHSERRKLNQEPLNEERVPPTPTQAEADFIESSDAPQTTVSSGSLSSSRNGLALLRRQRVYRHIVPLDGDVSFTNEPSIAAHGKRILATWNWGAALSTDGGTTFRYLDPYTSFPTAHHGFCCDQLAYFVPQRDLWVWVLQYSSDETGNILRIAWARGDSDFDVPRMTFFDLSPASLPNSGYSQSAWFDYNGVSSTSKYLYVSSNVVDTGYEGVVIRIPLSELAAGSVNPQDVQYFKTRLMTPRLVLGATSTMYFASHLTTSTLSVWTWADDSDSITRGYVTHWAYRTWRYHCPRKGGSATSDWCLGLRNGYAKNDDRPSAGWLANGRLGWAWNAAQDRAHGFRYPFVMAVEIDKDKLKRLDQPIIWSSKYAYQYAAITPNARGRLAGVVDQGGGTRYLSCAAVVRRPGDGWGAYPLDSSNADPAEPRAGDYLGISSGVGTNSWAGACSTLRGGPGRSNENVGYFLFRRRGG
jgi:uncharacterized membrane protein